MATPAGHARKSSTRASLVRRHTKGPLDIDDPLADAGTASDQQSMGSSNSSIAEITPILEAEQSLDRSFLPEDTTTVQVKDLSFLLDSSVYHPISQMETPAPFRRPFPASPKPGESLAEVTDRLDRLLYESDYLGAAQLSGALLTSGLVKPTDAATIFRILGVRYACLELSGNLALAAQEAKSLEDLNSAFYYNEPAVTADSEVAMAEHIMPFSLRVQALRLQSIGFSDMRRGVSALYDLAMECRDHVFSPTISAKDHDIWSANLAEIGVRVVNTLIEMGDLECAKRTLASLKPAGTNSDGEWLSRMIMLNLKMGQIGAAHRLIGDAQLENETKSILRSFVYIAEGEYHEAAKILSTQTSSKDSEVLVVARQNLAVAYLYVGEIQKSKELLESLINDKHSFQSITINLATLYDLSSDHSKEQKLNMAERIHALQNNSHQPRSFTNVDFKL